MVDKLSKPEVLALTKAMLRPVRGVPFDWVIKGICGKEVIHFDPKNSAHKRLSKAVIEAATRAGKLTKKKPIQSKRPNEAGNYLEPLLMDAFNDIGVKASRPKTRLGKDKISGYPDLEISIDGIAAYIECKTYAETTEDTTFRSFYFSPSSDPKISRDALHFVVGFRLDQIRSGEFVAKRFKVLSLNSMEVNVKYEFNTNNQSLYSGKNGGKILFESAL